MATGDELRRLALSLAGTIEAPHFDRRAFKVARTFATLAADARSANLKLTPDMQAFKCMMAPDIYTAIPNAWGRQGWTRIELAAIGPEKLEAALREAWTGAQKMPKAQRRR